MKWNCPAIRFTSKPAAADPTLVYADGVQLYGGQLEAPVLDGAQVFALGEGQSSVIQRDGKTMGSYEQRYAIFPSKAAR